MNPAKITMVSRIGPTILGESMEYALEYIGSLPAKNSQGGDDVDGDFVSNPIRYCPVMTDKLEKACSIGLVLVDEAEDVRDIPLDQICTDQRTVVRDKVRSLITAIGEGEEIDSLPILVRFEYENRWIIRDGNHRAAAELLLGSNYLKCKVIHVKHSFM